MNNKCRNSVTAVLEVVALPSIAVRLPSHLVGMTNAVVATTAAATKRKSNTKKDLWFGNLT